MEQRTKGTKNIQAGQDVVINIVLLAPLGGLKKRKSPGTAGILCVPRE
jgi:hypothetical protein